MRAVTQSTAKGINSDGAAAQVESSLIECRFLSWVSPCGRRIFGIIRFICSWFFVCC